jgi:hypothetical protein
VTPPYTTRTSSPIDSITPPMPTYTQYFPNTPLTPDSSIENMQQLFQCEEAQNMEVSPEHVLGKHLWDVL